MNLYTKSPFLPLYQHVGNMMRVKTTGTFQQHPYFPSETLIKKVVEDWQMGSAYGREFASIADAEDEIISKIPPPTSTYHHPQESRHVDQVLAILVNRQANLIAARTRLGAGNVLLTGASGLSILQSSTTSAFAHTDGFAIGRWTEVGVLNSSVRVYLGPHLPNDIVYVIGTGNGVPGHANLIEHESKLFLITEPPFAAEEQIGSHNFYGSVKIEYLDY
jgi:hypothetical protein